MEQCISFRARGRDTSGIFSLQAKGYGQQHPRKQQEAGSGCKALDWIWTDDLLWENPSTYSGPACLAQGHNKNGTILNGDTSATEGALKESGINSTWKGHITSSPKPPTGTCTDTRERGTRWQLCLSPTTGHQELSLGTNLVWEALLRWSEVLVPLLEGKCCLCLYPAASFMSSVTWNKPLSLAAVHMDETGLEVLHVCDKHKRKRTKIKCFVSTDPWNLWSRALCYNRHKACFVLKYEDIVFPRYFSFFLFWRLFSCILWGMCQDNARKDKNLTFNTEVDLIVHLFLCATQKELLVFVEH